VHVDLSEEKRKIGGDYMGQSIIFVGGANLNRNSDNQSMYKNSYRNNLTPSRDQFYNELCAECRTFPGKKNRNKKIVKLRSKYQGSACSDSAMEKVFISYLECFGRKMEKRENRKKVVELPVFLESNKVDKRIIKRIRVIENLKPASTEKKQVKKNRVTIEKGTIRTDKNKSIIQSHVPLPKLTTKERNARTRNFYKMLHDYLIESVSNPQVLMTQELAENCLLFNRDAAYIEGVRRIYRDAIKNDLTLLQAYDKNNFPMFHKDRKGLNNAMREFK